jgi:hypothetical protein
MASFLNELYMCAPAYASDVLDDLQFVLDLHYTTLPEMVCLTTAVSATHTDDYNPNTIGERTSGRQACCARCTA